MTALDLKGDFATDVRPARKASGRKAWAKDPTSAESTDGTRLDATFVNDILGLLRGLFAAAGTSPAAGDDAALVAAVGALIGSTPPAAHTHAVSSLTDGSGYVRMTDAERAKLAALKLNFKGSFATLAELQTAYPTGAADDWAVLMLVGEPATIAVWDTDVDDWVDIDTAPPATASQVPFAPAGAIAATNVQAAIEETYSESARATHGHAVADVTGLQVALDAKAPLASPALTGTPTAPTPAANDNSVKLATTAFVQLSNPVVVPVLDALASDNSPALQTAVDAATAAGRARVMLPPGDYRFAQPVVINQNDAEKRIDVRGHGKVTRLRCDTGSGVLFDVGSHASALTERATFADFLVENVGSPTAGGAFRLRHTKGLRFSGIAVKACLLPFELGDPTVADSVVDTIMEAMRLSASSGNSPFISLRSGASLTIDGGSKFDGNGGTAQHVVRQNDTSYNWDGLEINGLVGEYCASLITATGKGLSNARVANCIVDRPYIAHIRLIPASGGVVRRVVVSNMIFQGHTGANTVSGVYASQSSGGVVDGIGIDNCQFFDIGNQPLFFGDDVTGIRVTGNDISDCGFNATPLVRLGANAVATVTGNTGRAPSRTGYTYGIHFDGAGAKRAHSGNAWHGYATAETIGTP